MLNPELKLVPNLQAITKESIRDGFGKSLASLGQKNKDIVVVCADLLESTRMHWFAEEFPERVIEVGVAEQNLMGVGAGLSLAGKVPVVSSYAVFSPGRNWDQTRVSVCYTNANVKIIGGHAGLSTGADGATHQALEDLAITRVLPNLTVIVPADFEQAKKAMEEAIRVTGPVYLRATRGATGVFTSALSPFEIGKAQLMRSGKDLTIFACGPLVYDALIAAEALSALYDIEVINVHTLKPIDKETIISSARKTKKVITLEEHQIIGGLGSAVAEVLGENQPTRMRRMGIRDHFGESGESGQLLDKYGLNIQAVIDTIKDFINSHE